MRTIGVIPARFASTRFPGKVLANIGGKPLIQHVWEKAVQCQELDEVLIACDHDDVLKAAKGFGAQAAMTDPAHPSGSDRIAEAVKDIKADMIVNIQGDEPFIDARTIDDLARLLKQDANILMGTVIKPITEASDMANPNVVKCVVDAQGFALYFSRAPIPFQREGEPAETLGFKHLGLYAYDRDFLMEFNSWPKGALESVEKLEQLRALERGIKIKTTVTFFESIAVDTPQDLQKAITWFAQSKSMTR